MPIIKCNTLSLLWHAGEVSSYDSDSENNDNGETESVSASDGEAKSGKKKKRKHRHKKRKKHRKGSGDREGSSRKRARSKSRWDSSSWQSTCWRRNILNVRKAETYHQKPTVAPSGGSRKTSVCILLRLLKNLPTAFPWSFKKISNYTPMKL